MEIFDLFRRINPLNCYTCSIANDKKCRHPANLEDHMIETCGKEAKVCQLNSTARFCSPDPDIEYDEKDPTKCGDYEDHGDETPHCCVPVNNGPEACNNQDLLPFKCFQCKVGEPGCGTHAPTFKECKNKGTIVCKTTAKFKMCGDAEEKADADGFCVGGKEPGKCCTGLYCNAVSKQPFPNIKCKQCKIVPDKPHADDEKCLNGDLEPTECDTGTYGRKPTTCVAYNYRRRCSDDEFANHTETGTCFSFDMSESAYNGTCCFEDDEECSKIPIPEVHLQKAPDFECYKCTVDPKADNKYCPNTTTEVTTCKNGVRRCILKDNKWQCGIQWSDDCSDLPCCETSRCNMGFYCYSCKVNITPGTNTSCEENPKLRKCPVDVTTCKLKEDTWGCGEALESCEKGEQSFCCNKSKCNVKISQDYAKKKNNSNTDSTNKPDTTEDQATVCYVSLATLLMQLLIVIGGV